MALAGCTTRQPPAEENIDRQPFWPRAPDTPRFVYEHTLRTPGDIMMDVRQLRVLRTLTGDLPPTRRSICAQQASQTRKSVNGIKNQS